MSLSLSAIILAGGEGRRMNYANKGLELFQGKSLIRHVIHRVSHQVDDIVISANRDLEKFADLGFPIVTDQGESQGPLSGIKSAVQECRHDMIFITACDLPNLPLDIVDRLLRDFNGIAATAKVSGRVEPLASLVSRTAIGNIDAVLDAGKRSVMYWLESSGGKVVPISNTDPKAFLNVNTPEDLG